MSMRVRLGITLTIVAIIVIALSLGMRGQFLTRFLPWPTFGIEQWRAPSAGYGYTMSFTPDGQQIFARFSTSFSPLIANICWRMALVASFCGAFPNPFSGTPNRLQRIIGCVK
jgi:hypothetical protein